MYQKSRESGLDRDLVLRVSALSTAGQRWLRTVLVAIEDLDATEAPRREGSAPKKTQPKERRRERPRGNLEDVITGKSTLDKELEEYPELSEEMEGLAEVIDLLREAGQARRRTGEQILREEVLGEPGEEPEDTDEEPGESEEEPGDS